MRRRNSWPRSRTASRMSRTRSSPCGRNAVRESGAHVLVVDDDPVNRSLLARSLEREGHRHAIAENGREALEMLRAEPFDVVLLDVLMPEMGADDYLPKPFDPVLLRARMNGSLTKKRLHDLERDRVRGTFSRFVPEPVVDELLRRTDDDLRLPGARVDATALSSDLRAFTTFAETTTATDVIEALNNYLAEMTDAILDSGGTLVGYMGDGIMAVFGAPIEAADHADRALGAAREMLHERLPRFNQWLAENGVRDGFRIGIGVSSGPLMSGTVGSARRLDYTVIGDTANTASRLESMTKQTPHSILISESTRQFLRHPPDDLVFVGEVEVRGKQAPIRLWTLGPEL